MYLFNRIRVFNNCTLYCWIGQDCRLPFRLSVHCRITYNHLPQVTTVCGHHICQECLVMSFKNDVFTCPSCRKTNLSGVRIKLAYSKISKMALLMSGLASRSPSAHTPPFRFVSKGYDIITNLLFFLNNYWKSIINS